MLTSVHLLTGAAIGKLTGNPWIASFVSYVFHHILDAIPHYNPQAVRGYVGKNLRNADKKDLILKSIEPAISLILVSYLILTSQSRLIAPMILGTFFGWLPDLFVFINWKYKPRIIRIPVMLEKKFHKHTSFWKGMWPQAIIVLLSLAVILR